MGEIEKKLQSLGITLPNVMQPVGSYVDAVRVGNLLFMGGQGPQKDGELLYKGKLGRELTVAQGYEAARLVALNALAALKEITGDLDNVARIIKVLGFVNAAETFTESPQVIDGFSDLLVELWGDDGRHARSAIGMHELPLNISVEVEMVVELKAQA